MSRRSRVRRASRVAVPEALAAEANAVAAREDAVATAVPIDVDGDEKGGGGGAAYELAVSVRPLPAGPGGVFAAARGVRATFVARTVVVNAGCGGAAAGGDGDGVGGALEFRQVGVDGATNTLRDGDQAPLMWPDRHAARKVQFQGGEKQLKEDAAKIPEVRVSSPLPVAQHPT